MGRFIVIVIFTGAIALLKPPLLPLDRIGFTILVIKDRYTGE
jgi:hypothetical protein